MEKRKGIITATIVLFIGILTGSQIPLPAKDWQAEGQKKVNFLIRKNGPGTDLNLQRRLWEMRVEPQDSSLYSDHNSFQK